MGVTSARGFLTSIVALLAAQLALATDAGRHPLTVERVFEWTVESKRIYGDPFNDVDVDVVFERAGQRWRVPAFWRGGSRWTVRFAPPLPGNYRFHLDSTDKANPDLNGHDDGVTITAYTGNNLVLRRGMIRVSSNKRYFEQADGTPFYWLGDTWWTGLSDRLPWEGFQTLAQDRKGKGFTVIQIAAGLIPSDEELAPSDPGFCNEGGCVWDPKFHEINPQYFDYADRRIQYLLDNGLVPAIVGGWGGPRQGLPQVGVEKMKKHWRYVIARYGAYPVIWIGGGEAFDPGEDLEQRWGSTEQFRAYKAPGWTEIIRYIRNTDPYHHPLTAHEIDPPYDSPVQDESLTDFDLFQAGHRGWPSIATEIALLDKHYARTTVTKPLVVGEIGYEKQAGENFEAYQRAAFWLAMLNGAAGFTYGTLPVAEAYTPDKPFHRFGRVSLYTWQEGMQFPGAAQVAMNAKLLRRYPWWAFQPHPEWVVPQGTTLLEPNNRVSGFDIDLIEALEQKPAPPPDTDLPLGEWHDRHGNWRLPYAAGIPGQVRVIYLPNFGFKEYAVPTVHQLELGVRYHAYYWEPVLGIKVDLGFVEHTAAGGDLDISHLDRRLDDDRGTYRGTMSGPGWDDYGTHQRIEGDSYQPEAPPTMGDWLLVLEAQNQPGQR